MRPVILSFSPSPSIIKVFSLSTLTVLARPNISKVASFSSRPSSSEITLPLVKIAISSSIAFLLSPKPGAFTATQLNVPRSLFKIKVASASPSTSSAMIISFAPCCTICSKSGSNSCMFEIFFSVIRIYGFSISATIFSISVHI